MLVFTYTTYIRFSVNVIIHKHKVKAVIIKKAYIHEAEQNLHDASKESVF